MERAPPRDHAPDRRGLRLLLSRGNGDGERDEPVLPRGLPLESLRGAPLPELRADATTEPRPLGDASADASLLRERRWGLVVPAAEPLAQQLLQAVDRLVALRALQSGLSQAELLAHNVYRAPTDPHLGDGDAADWYQRRVLEEDRPAAARRGELERPDYLLILGDLHQVPEAIQRVLTLAGHFVGRLAFSTLSGEPRLEDYRRYCDKVVRAAGTPDEDSGSDGYEAARRRLHLGWVNDGTEATALGRELLVAPLLTRLAARDRGGLPVELNPPESAALLSSDELRQAAAQLERSVLFTVSHGYGGPRAGWERPDDPRRLQGAMSFPRSRRLTAEELLSEPRPFVKDGVWLMLACYGAGTPAQSQFYRWLQQARPGLDPQAADEASWVQRSLPGPGARPFIAALPQAVLAHEDGPLAFVGHLDLAWSYSFENAASQADFDHFEAFLRTLLRAARVGPALSSLMQKRRRAEQALLRGYDQARLALTSGEPAVPPPAAGSLAVEPAQLRQWMTRQDLVGYVLLGDPAARLPRRPRAAAPAPTPPQILTPRPGDPPAVAQPLTPPPREPSPRDLEDAAARQILGRTDAASTTAGTQELIKRYRAGGRAALATHPRLTGKKLP